MFLGEYKSGSKINGFHNWVQFYLLEKKGELNYWGYVREDAVSCFGNTYSVVAPTSKFEGEGEQDIFLGGGEEGQKSQNPHKAFKNLINILSH